MFVATDEHERVIAYYALATGSILREEIPKSARRNTPRAIPVLVIGRLAVDMRHQGSGIGRSLVQDALLRCARVSVEVGFMFVAVHPANEAAREFWMGWGLAEAPTTPPALLLPLPQLRAIGFDAY